MTGVSLMNDTGHSKPVLCDNLEGGGGEEGGREVQEGGDTCIPKADSYRCTAKTSQYCKITIFQLNKFNKKTAKVFSEIRSFISSLIFY